MLVIERFFFTQFMHQPFRVDPTQRMLADVELPGIVTQHDGVAQKFVCLNAAHKAPSVATLTGSGVTFNTLKPNRSRCACGRTVAEPRLRSGLQTGDRIRWRRRLVSHVVVSRIVEHVVLGTPARSRSRKFSRLFDDRVRNHVNHSLPIYVQNPFLPA